MAASAFVLGGTGQIGTEVAKLLALSGWTVTSLDRGSRAPSPELAELGVERRVGDRQVAGELEAAIGAGADVLVDTVAFDLGDALQLAGLAGVVGSVVAISSASVYRDLRGRTLDEATKEEEFPVLPVPVSESHPTVAPGAIRAGAAHGPFSRHAREWFLLKARSTGVGTS